MKRFSKRKGIILLLIISYLYLSFWSMCMAIIYRPLFKEVGGSRIAGYAHQYEEGYTYGVSSPNFLCFTGNIFILPNMETVSESIKVEPAFGIMIWPKLFGEYDVAVTYEYPLEESTATHYIQVKENIFLNENMEPSNWKGETNSYENQILYKQYYDEIKEVYQMVYDKWGILEPK